MKAQILVIREFCWFKLPLVAFITYLNNDKLTYK